MATTIPEHDQSIRWIALSLFIASALFIFAYAMYCLSIEEKPLQCKIQTLKRKKEKTLQEVQLLRDMTQGLNDPSADEYALITRQGKIPEGYKKMSLGDLMFPQNEEEKKIP